MRSRPLSLFKLAFAALRSRGVSLGVPPVSAEHLGKAYSIYSALLSVRAQQIQCGKRSFLAVARTTWRGSLLDSLETVVRFAQRLTFKGKHSVVSLITQTDETGILPHPEGNGGIRKAH